MRNRLVLALSVAACAVAPLRATHALSLDLIRPVAGSIVRHFEPPPDPYSAGHRGIDLAVPTGTRVVASAPGTVSFAGQVAGNLFVSIDHAGGYHTTYSFLSAILVKKGQAVAQGQPIARSGGCHPGDTQPCLHFGLKQDATYLDPEPYLLDDMRRNLWRVVHLTA
jgi:murein DD-endopeptidase MepM/ murein hydrolase activator NlpD